MRSRRVLVLLIAFVIVIAAAACGDDSGSSSDGAGDGVSTETGAGGSQATSEATSEATSGGGTGGGGASTLTFDDEEVALSSRGCYDEEQDVAGSIITLTAQASGTNAAGEDVTVDFTRYAAGGTVGEGDDITIDVGPLGASTTYHANLPIDTATVEGGVLTVPETTYMSFDDGSEVAATVMIAC